MQTEQSQREEYSKEFDDLVIKYMKWIESLETKGSRFKRRFSAFLEGMASIRIYPPKISYNDISGNPLTCLDDFQRDAVSLASDWNAVRKDLEKILSGHNPEIKYTKKEAELGIKLSEDIYNTFRESYISSRMAGN